MSDVIDRPTAEAKLRDAVNARDGMLQRAARGETITTADIRRAEDVARDAETELGIARAVEVHHRTEAEKAQIAQLQTEADTHQAAVADAAKAFVASARAVDEILDVARSLADQMDAARAVLLEADQAAHAHNGVVAMAAHENNTMRSMHPSVWPKARTAGPAPMRFGGMVEVALATMGNTPIVHHQSATQMAIGAVKTIPGLS